MAGGTFNEGEVKVIPGEYHREVSENNTPLAAQINGVGAGLFKSNWGPLNVVVEFDTDSYGNVEKIFGAGMTEDVITEMFNGGISSGYFVRIGTGGEAPTVSLKDTAETAADVVQITGNYVGNRPFTISVRESLVNENEKEVIIYSGTTEFERATFATSTDGEVEAIIAAINNNMSNFTAKKLTDGNGKIATVAQTALTGGSNPTATAQQYTDGLALLEAYDWNCLAVDTEDVAIHLLVQAYVDRIFKAGSFPLACVAEKSIGDGAVELEKRMTHAKAFNDKKMHYVLNAAYDSSGKLYDGYKNAARIAGYIASIATNKSLTKKPIAGYATLAKPLTSTELKKALQSGCIALSLNKKRQVIITQGINTLITPGDDEDEGWKKIRRVKTRYELIQRGMAALEDLEVDNDEDGEATVIAKLYGVYSAMRDEKKLFPGGRVYKVSNSDLPDSGYFAVECDDKESMEKIYVTFYFRFTRAQE